MNTNVLMIEAALMFAVGIVLIITGIIHENKNNKQGGSKQKKHNYSTPDIDRISDEFSGEALDWVIKEKEREKKRSTRK